MRIGRLRDNLVIKKPDGKQDSYGSESGNYIKVFSARGNFSILSGSQLVKANVELTKEYASILMRYTDRLKHEHVIEFKGNIYDVEGIKPDGKNHAMTVTVSRDIT